MVPEYAVRRRSVPSKEQKATAKVRSKQQKATATAPVRTSNPFWGDEEAQDTPHIRSVSMQNDSSIAQNALKWLTQTSQESALDTSQPSALDKWRYAHSSFGSDTTSLGSTDTSRTPSRTSSRRPSGGDLAAPIARGGHVATRLAHPQDGLSPLPKAPRTGPGATQQATQATQTDSPQPPASASTPGPSAPRLPALGQRTFAPEAILLTELLTNVTSLASTLVGDGPGGYVAARAVGPLGLVNGAQLFHSNWANAGEAGANELSVLASIGSLCAAVMSTWTGWWSSQAADFHSRVGAIAGIASEIADVRDAWADRNDNPARSVALVIRILSIWAASISAFLAISEAEDEGSMAPAYGLSASVLPVVGTFAGVTAEALSRTSVQNRLRALVDHIRALIRRLTHLLGYGERDPPPRDPYLV